MPADGATKRHSNIGQHDPMFAEDVWEIEGLALGLEVPHYNPSKTLNFAPIESDVMRRAVKQFVYFELATGIAIGTVQGHIGHLKRFSSYVLEELGAPSFEGLSRADVTAFIMLIEEASYSDDTINNALSALTKFFDCGVMLNLQGMPASRLLVDQRLRKHTDPSFTDPYSQGEIDSMLEHLDDYDPQVRRMFLLSISVLIRFSEVTGMKIGQLLRNEDGQWSLLVHLYKTKAEHLVPATDEVAALIMEAHAESQRLEPGTEYVFLNRNAYKGRHNPVSRQAFTSSMQKTLDRFGVLSDEGEPLHVATHRFRAYLATKYLNLGYDVEYVRMLLGHVDSKSLWHYAQIHAKYSLDTMKPVLENREWHIKNMGKIFETRRIEAEGKMLIPLANGACAKPLESGRCRNANRCYECTFFVPDPDNLGTYLRQLEHARSNLAIAISEGLTRQAEINEALVRKLEKIIDSLE